MTEEKKPVAPPVIIHTVSLAEHNFIVKTLNRNPLQLDVMEVSNLINRLQNTAIAAVKAAEEAAKTAANDPAASRSKR